MQESNDIQYCLDAIYDKKQATDIESFKLGYSRIAALLREIDKKYALLKIKTKIDKVTSCNDLSKILDEMTHLIYETQVGKAIRNTSDRTYLAIGRNARRANEVLLPYKDRLFTESSLDAVHEFELKINNIKRNLKNFQGWIDDKANSIINPKPKQVKVVTVGEIEKEVGHLSKKTINSIAQSPNVEIIKNDTIKTWPKLQQLPGRIDVEIKGIEQGETTDPESGSFKFEQGKTKNKVMFINSARGFVDLSNYLDQPLFAKVEGLIQWSGIIPEEMDKGDFEEAIKNFDKQLIDFRLLNIEDDFGKFSGDFMQQQELLLDRKLKDYVSTALLNACYVKGIKPQQEEISNNDLVVMETQNESPFSFIKRLIARFKN